MLMLVFRVYAATVAVTLLSQMLTTARAQIHGISLSDDELLHTIFISSNLSLTNIYLNINFVLPLNNIVKLSNAITRFANGNTANMIVFINSLSPNGMPWICDLSVVNISNNKVTATVAA